jgi:hypothetical protein
VGSSPEAPRKGNWKIWKNYELKYNANIRINSQFPKEKEENS